MKIRLTSVFVSDQQKALDFYTQVIGFKVKNDSPIGEDRWLTVVSPDEPDGVELLLEPNSNPAAQAYQKSLLEQNIPATAFQTDDIHAEVERMKKLGAIFTMEPTQMEEVTLAIFGDTCGNLIQIYQD
jgi:predicted enzyme related to lactoylglutathione lyase